MQAPFPKTLSFSAAVPEIYGLLRDFVDTSVRFVEDLDLSHTEVDEMTRKSANQLLVQTLGGPWA